MPGRGTTGGAGTSTQAPTEANTMATVVEIMAELESLGTEQNRKIYARHGAKLPMFGVSFANFGKLARRLETDHDLALGLWRTGNLDARVLATMIADPARMDVATAEQWARACNDYGLTDAICRPIGASPVARRLAEKWHGADDEWLGTAGWNLIAILTGDESVPDSYFEPLIDTIEREIHGRKNRVRYAMNNALIAIGIRSERLRRKATAAAKKIGVVHVDHGETGCKTPDAASYIEKAVAYRMQREARKRTSGGTTRRAKVATARGGQETDPAKKAARARRTRAASVRHRIHRPRHGAATTQARSTQSGGRKPASRT
jgi:3-methyladenine DNA glycosylase AlkD